MTIAPELAAELEREPAWMYPWDLPGGVSPPLLHAGLPGIHDTRLELLVEPVREALRAAGAGARSLDLGCCEGWFGHRLLELGADHVLGVDVREGNIRRARLVRDALGVPSDCLDLRVGSVFDLDASDVGSFDVVLMLGLIYHVEEPIRALRTARELTNDLLIVESQLLRPLGDVRFGLLGETEPVGGCFGLYVEPFADVSPLASEQGVVAMVPDLAGLLLSLKAAGFSDLQVLSPGPSAAEDYKVGNRVVVAAR